MSALEILLLYLTHQWLLTRELQHKLEDIGLWLNVGMNFDSLADFDDMANAFEPILLKYNNQYIFNKTRFQSEYSSLCGLYCLYYLYYRSTHAYENTINMINELSSRWIADNESLLLNFFLESLY